MTTADKYNHILTALMDADTPEATEAIELLKEVEQLFLKTGGLAYAARDRLKIVNMWMRTFGDAIDGTKRMPSSEGVDLIIQHNTQLLQKIKKEID